MTFVVVAAATAAFLADKIFCQTNRNLLHIAHSYFIVDPMKSEMLLMWWMCMYFQLIWRAFYNLSYLKIEWNRLFFFVSVLFYRQYMACYRHKCVIDSSKNIQLYLHKKNFHTRRQSSKSKYCLPFDVCMFTENKVQINAFTNTLFERSLPFKQKKT